MLLICTQYILFSYITSSPETCLNLVEIEKDIQSTMAKIAGLHIQSFILNSPGESQEVRESTLKYTQPVHCRAPTPCHTWCQALQRIQNE